MTSKIGLHIVLGPRNGYGDFLRRLAGAGLSLALVKCVEDFGAALEAKQILGDGNVTTMGRINHIDGMDMQAREPRDWPSAQAAAESYYALARLYWAAHPYIDIWESFNEMSAHWAWQGDFFIALMDLAERDGFRLAHYACSTGNPPDQAAAAEMIDCLRETMRRGHYLSLHEYGGVGTSISTLRGTEPFHALRHRWLYAQMPVDARPNIIISECGQDAGYEFAGAPAFVEDFAWYDTQLEQTDYVQACAAWTLGNWHGANFQDALPALAEYIVSRPDLEPPQLPSRPRGKPRLQYQRVYFVIPPMATEAQAIEIFRRGWRESKRTVGASYDDAGIGDLDSRKAVLWNVPESDRLAYVEFYRQWYPGVVIEFRML